jgi:hypothetical protein
MGSEAITLVNYGLVGCDALYVDRYVKRFMRNVLHDRRLQKSLKEKRSKRSGNVDSS